MSKKSDRAIREAIRDCLVICLGCEMPLSGLSGCLDELRQKRWPTARIHAVETTVVKILARLADNDPGVADNDLGLVDSDPRVVDNQSQRSHHDR